MPWLTTYQNFAFGPKLRGDMRGGELARVTDRLLDKVCLSDFKDKFPLQLSGGMQRRAELARAEAAQMRIHCDVDERRVVHRRGIPARRFMAPSDSTLNLKHRVHDERRAEGCARLWRHVSFRVASNCRTGHVPVKTLKQVCIHRDSTFDPSRRDPADRPQDRPTRHASPLN